MEKRLRVFPLAGNAKAEVADFAGREGFTRSKRGGGEVEREMSEKGWGERGKGVKKKKKNTPTRKCIDYISIKRLWPLWCLT